MKELSKGVQREMNAGIAGVARMIERLDLASKRATVPSPPVPSFTEGTSGFPLKGKAVQENGSEQSLNVPVQENSIEKSLGSESGVKIHNVSSDSGTVICQVEVPHPCVQVHITPLI